MDWVEQLLELRNLDYHNLHAKAPAKAPRAHQTVPDLKDNDFWDKGEVTK